MQTNKQSFLKYFKEALSITYALKRTYAYCFKVNPVATTLVLTLFFLSSLIITFQAYVVSNIVDNLIKNLDTINSLNNSNIKTLVFIQILLLVISNLIGRFRQYFRYKMMVDFSKEFELDITKKLATLDETFFEKPETINLINKVRENHGGRPLNFISESTMLIRDVIDIISISAIIIVYKPVFIIVIILSAIPAFILNLFYGKQAWYIWGAKADLRKEYTYTKSYLTGGSRSRELKVFRIREYLLDRMYKTYTEFQNEQNNVMKNRTFKGLFLDFIEVAANGGAYVLLIADVLDKNVSIGRFSFYATSINRLQGAISAFFGKLTIIYENGLFMIDFFELLDMKNTIISGNIKIPNVNAAPEIEFKNFSFKYPEKKEYVIKDLNLVIKPNEHIAIVGENGAGKTTLIKCLMRFYDPTEGQILINGIDIKQIDLDSWYKIVGTIFQDFISYHFDAKTNIGIGNIDKLQQFEDIVEASKKSGAHLFIDEYDKKYDQILNKGFEGGTDLSGGQWQRVALARAFFKDSPVLILDEPTSAIDPKGEFEIFEKLFEFTQNKTVIIISHRFSTVRNASRIIVLEKGNIIEDGSHEELMAINSGKYKTAFEIQKKGYE